VILTHSDNLKSC